MTNFKDYLTFACMFPFVAIGVVYAFVAHAFCIGTTFYTQILRRI